MKKLLCLFLLLPCLVRAQTIINAAGQQQSASHTNTVIAQRLSNKGGYYGIVPDTATRNAIPGFKRDTGFRVTVLRPGLDTIDYIWPVCGTCPGNWVKLNSGGGKNYTGTNGVNITGTVVSADTSIVKQRAGANNQFNLLSTGKFDKSGGVTTGQVVVERAVGLSPTDIDAGQIFGIANSSITTGSPLEPRLITMGQLGTSPYFRIFNSAGSGTLYFKETSGTNIGSLDQSGNMIMHSFAINSGTGNNFLLDNGSTLNINTKENTANKTNIISNSTSLYPSVYAIGQYTYPKSHIDSLSMGLTNTLVSFSAGATNPVSLTWSTYNAVYGSNPSLIVQELVSTGVYRDRTDIQPTRNYTGTTLTSISFDFGIVPNGRIKISP